MTDRSQNDGIPDGGPGGDEDVDLRLGRHVIELLQAAVPAMAARGWGRVLAIGSVNETRPDPELSVYAALKTAQHNVIINLAKPSQRYVGSLGDLKA